MLKIGQRVRLNGKKPEDIIPAGAIGTIIQESGDTRYVVWDTPLLPHSVYKPTEIVSANTGNVLFRNAWACPTYRLEPIDV